MMPKRGGRWCWPVEGGQSRRCGLASRGCSGQSACVNETPPEVERWSFGDRYYGVALASAPDSMVLELDDLGPGLARGLVMAASLSDSTGSMTVRVFTDAALPASLVQQFLSEAQVRLPPNRNAMSDELRRALFEDLAVIRDRSASSSS